MAERKGGARAPKTDTTVSGADWCGQNISGQSHTAVLFVDLDMTEVENDGAAFTDCTFRRARFNVSTHTNAAFVNCTFVNCNFFDATFTDCKFVGSMFDRCAFNMTKVVGGNWSFVGLPGTDLGTAFLSDVRMREADLTGVRCRKGSIKGVDLSGASLHRADLAGCDLRGSDLSALDPRNVEIDGAIVTANQALVIASALGLVIESD